MITINTTSVPKDRWGEPYTEERVRSSARDHVAYGWSKRPGGWTGDPWTPELLEAYDDEYEKQARIGKYAPKK